jgi:GT2 family glycosyltransferase
VIPVLVPRRNDNGLRDLLWRHLQLHYWATLPGYDITTGESPSGPFNRAAAVNRAAKRAGQWRVAVIADSDTWVPPEQLAQAVTVAYQTGRLTAAFTHVVELTEAATASILVGQELLDAEKIRTREIETQSSMLVIPRELWDTVGGFDEKFVGWAAEDNAFWRACQLHGGEPERIKGPAYHLWHPPAQRQGAAYRANQIRWRRYAAAQTIEELPCRPSASSPTPAA